ncbi:hypothetical protein ACOME3_003692 [Neoechinorhynchus agilis]
MLHNLADSVDIIDGRLSIVDRWMLHRIKETANELRNDLTEFEYLKLSSKLQQLFKGDFSDFYIEATKIIKPSKECLRQLLSAMLRLHYPIIPSVCQNVWEIVLKQTNDLAKEKYFDDSFFRSVEGPDYFDLIDLTRDIIYCSLKLKTMFGCGKETEIKLRLNRKDISQVKDLKEVIEKLSSTQYVEFCEENIPDESDVVLPLNEAKGLISVKASCCSRLYSKMDVDNKWNDHNERAINSIQ